MLEMHDGGIVIRFLAQTRDFIRSINARRDPGSKQPLIHTDIKRLRFEADNSPPSETKFKNEWSYISTPNTSSWCARVHNLTFVSFKTQQPK
jgi:hypothetical protein